MAALSDVDRDFLAALRDGETIAGYARSHSYSKHWAKWQSRKLRRRFGVQTIGEAVLMGSDENGVSRADFDKLFGAFTKLSDAVEDLAKRPDEPAAKEQVRERELSVKELAEKLGLSLEDVERVKGEKEYERWKTFEERRTKELEDEEGSGEEVEENGAGKGIGEVIRDGLGGIRNVKPT